MTTYLQPGTDPELCRPREVVPNHVSQSDRFPFGLVTIKPVEWSPKNARSNPPSITDGMSAEISRSLALAFNASEHARQRQRWACLTAAGTVLILTGIADEDRPTGPTAFPTFVETVLTKDEAMQRMELANADRHRLARIPREWTIAVCPLAEGGAQ